MNKTELIDSMELLRQQLK